MKKKICIIGVYFGTFPQYFPLWLKSCEQNSDIDFLIIGDQLLTNLPSNVTCVQMSLDDIRARATNALGFNAVLEAPYKCCDYRPMFGLIFADLLERYDYWGHCDFDMIFGDLSSYFERYSLETYDKFLTWGHLSLYRNADEVNKRFLQGDYKRIYTMAENVAFDEIYGIGQVFIKNAAPMFREKIFADIASTYHRYRLVEEGKQDKPGNNYANQTFYWENGKVFRAYFVDGVLHKEEFVYIHFKKRPNFPLNFDAANCDAFYITNHGFEPKVGEVTMEDILRTNPNPGAAHERQEYRRAMAKVRVESVLGCIRRLFNKG